MTIGGRVTGISLRHSKYPMINPSAQAISLIKQFEGLSLKAYPDPGTGADPWTIGYGATGKGIKRGVVWTQEQADARLLSDVRSFAAGVSELVGPHTSQAQFDAIVTFAYNVGLSAFAKSTLRKMHEAKNFKGAADQFLRWNKAGGRVMRGLTRRREAERALYLS